MVRSRSDDFKVDVYLFPCGHGDTILLCLPGNKWVLVDCYLPENDGTRAKFFDFLKDHDVTRLHFVIQTHPDIDHFHGMTEVLDYFTTGGRSIGYWCDSGINADQIQALVFPDQITKKHFAKLQRRVGDLLDARVFGYLELADNHEPVSPKGYQGRVELYPIAPSAMTKRQRTRRDVERMAANPKTKLEANALSVVLAVSMRTSTGTCQVLLAADADSEELDAALDAWATKAGQIGCPSGFDVVKVPHHGSKDSHCARLAHAKSTESTNHVAAVSAGTREALPHPDVLREYIDNGWTVLLTTTRRRTGQRNRPGDLASRDPKPKAEITPHLISLSWSPTSGLSWGPPAARVDEKDLVHYLS